MRFHNSYQFKIFISLWGFGIVLVVMYLVIGISLSFFAPNADEVAMFELKKEIAYFFDSYKAHHQASYPNSKYLKTYLEAYSAPLHLQDKLDALENGYHIIKTSNVSGGNRADYVAVFNHPDSPHRFYVVYDYSSYMNDFIDFQFIRAPKRLSLAMAIVGVMGLFMGLYASKWLISPLKRLVSHVKDLNPECLPAHFSQHFKRDEVGVLARALDQSMQRITQFIEREKTFTRDASHELRTPVTVIKGAVELIRELPEFENRSLVVPVQRIERATRNMEELIESFLWLAREQHVETKEEPYLLGEIIKQVVEEHRHLIATKPVSVDIVGDDCPKISVPVFILKIVVGNIVKNAFIYTSKGRIIITVTPNYIQITNTGSEIPPEKLSTIKEPFQKGENSKGFGLGLAIVERLCNRFGFDLDINSDAESTTTVKLSFIEGGDGV